MTREAAPHPTFLCRAHLHHKWVPAQTEDGGQYMRCAHCGKDKTEVESGNLSAEGKILGSGLGNMGGGS